MNVALWNLILLVFCNCSVLLKLKRVEADDQFEMGGC
jgi:hypothetical protein